MMTDKNKLDDIYSLLDEVTKDEGNYEEKEASDREEKKVSFHKLQTYQERQKFILKLKKAEQKDLDMQFTWQKTSLEMNHLL